jgi:hypothetical protein
MSKKRDDGKEWHLPNPERKVRGPLDPEPAFTRPEKESAAKWLVIIGALVTALGAMYLFIGH